jgi:hypothetical protein
MVLAPVLPCLDATGRLGFQLDPSGAKPSVSLALLGPIVKQALPRKVKRHWTTSV